MAQIGDGLSKFVLSAEIQSFTFLDCLSLHSGPFCCKGPSLSSGMSMSCAALPSLQSTHSHRTVCAVLLQNVDLSQPLIRLL